MWVYPWGKSRNFCCFTTLKNRVYPATFAPRRLESSSTIHGLKAAPTGARQMWNQSSARQGRLHNWWWLSFVSSPTWNTSNLVIIPKNEPNQLLGPPTVKNGWPSRNHKETRGKGPAWAWTYKKYIIIYIYTHLCVCVCMHVCMWCNVMQCYVMLCLYIYSVF